MGESMTEAALSIVGGSLRILDNESLTSPAGLESLSSIGGELSMEGNPVLTSLAEMEGLSTVEGDLTIASNSSLCDDEVIALCTALGVGLGGSCSYSGNGSCP